MLRRRKNSTSNPNSACEHQQDDSTQPRIVQRNATANLRNDFVGIVDSVFQRPWRLFLVLCCFRILNVFLIQSFFDPDEYWQMLEPAYCAVFRPEESWDCGGYTWEWKRRAGDDVTTFIGRSLHGPVRSYLSVVPVHLFYWIVKAAGVDFHWVIARGPMFLSAVTVAAPIDMAVWYISDSRWALFASLTSWFGCYSYVRTYANCQEALLLILALALMQKNGHHIWQRCALAFFLGGLSVAMRFTSVASFVPLGLLLTIEQKPRRKLPFLLGICTPFALLGVFVSAVVDRWFYGFWTIPFLGSFHFNAILGLSTLYGSHPWFWYLTAGLPVVTGLLYPFFLRETYRWISALAAPFRERTRQQLWAIILTYVLMLSTSAHKEFRFLLPVLPLFCILLESRIALLMNRKWSVRLFLWLIPNAIVTVYLGVIHQSGSIAVMADVVKSLSRSGQETASLHLLLPCHSTPFRSHLHTRGGQVAMEVWHLECPPECRMDGTCESDLFQENPGKFLAEQYRTREKPDFVITSSHFEKAVTEELTLSPMYRHLQTISGVRWGDTTVDSVTITVHGVDLLVEEMVVLAR